MLPGASMHFSCRQPVGLPVPCQDNKILHPESVVKESPDKSLGHEQMAKSLLYVSTLDFYDTVFIDNVTSGSAKLQSFHIGSSWMQFWMP